METCELPMLSLNLLERLTKLHGSICPTDSTLAIDVYTRRQKLARWKLRAHIKVPMTSIEASRTSLNGKFSLTRRLVVKLMYTSRGKGSAGYSHPLGASGQLRQKSGENQERCGSRKEESGGETGDTRQT
jgi:hypothetical protein